MDAVSIASTREDFHLTYEGVVNIIRQKGLKELNLDYRRSCPQARSFICPFQIVHSGATHRKQILIVMGSFSCFITECFM